MVAAHGPRRARRTQLAPRARPSGRTSEPAVNKPAFGSCGQGGRFLRAVSQAPFRNQADRLVDCRQRVLEIGFLALVETLEFDTGESGTPASVSTSCWAITAPRIKRCALRMDWMAAGDPTPLAAAPSMRSTVDRARTSCLMDSTRAAVNIGMRPNFLRSIRPSSV